MSAIEVVVEKGPGGPAFIDRVTSLRDEVKSNPGTATVYLLLAMGRDECGPPVVMLERVDEERGVEIVSRAMPGAVVSMVSRVPSVPS